MRERPLWHFGGVTVKRMLGIVLAVVGGTGVLWGGFCLLSGEAHARFDITSDVSVTPMPAGLAGAALVVLGLVFTRE